MISSNRTYFIAIGCLLFALNIATAQAQKPSRAEAIAHIAELYPNSTKSPEQIYDEGQIEMTARTFSKRFGNRDLGALTGLLPEDSVREVEVPVKRPPVTTNRDSTETIGKTTPEKGQAPSDSTRQMTPAQDNNRQPVQTQKVLVERRSIFNTGNPVITTAKQDYSENERRDIRNEFLNIYKMFPSDVRIVLKPQKITYHGQTATVETKWAYDIVGHPNYLSRPYKDRPGGTVPLQLRLVGETWLVTNFQDLVTQLKTTLASQ